MEVVQLLQRATADPKEFIYIGYEYGIDQHLLGELRMSLWAAILWKQGTNETLGNNAKYWLESGVALLADERLSPEEEAGGLGEYLENIQTTVESRQDELASPSRAVFDYLNDINSDVSADDLVRNIDQPGTADQHIANVVDDLTLKEKRTLLFAELLNDLQEDNAENTGSRLFPRAIRASQYLVKVNRSPRYISLYEFQQSRNSRLVSISGDQTQHPSHVRPLPQSCSNSRQFGNVNGLLVRDSDKIVIPDRGILEGSHARVVSRWHRIAPAEASGHEDRHVCPTEHTDEWSERHRGKVTWSTICTREDPLQRTTQTCHHRGSESRITSSEN
jgi:hypothetical protein